METCQGWVTWLMVVVGLVGAGAVVYLINLIVRSAISFSKCKTWEKLYPEVVRDYFGEGYPNARYRFHDIQKSYDKQMLVPFASIWSSSRQKCSQSRPTFNVQDALV